MMRKIKYILFLIVLSLPCHLANAQFFLYNEAPIDIETSFTRHSLEAAAKQTFFNAFKIKNNANRTEIFTLNITVPQGWNVIGKDKIEVTLPPLDSIIIPLRVAIGGKVRGDIGYSVIASLTDSRGNTIKNEYCFVKIPRETELNIRIVDRIVYLDPTSNSSYFSVLVQNRGNREELVSFLFDGNRQLGIGDQKQFLLSQDITVPPFSDSLFTYRVELREEEIFGKKMFGLEAKVSNVDTTYKSIIWFKVTTSSIKNNIPSNEKPLSIESIAQGLLDSDIKPNFTNIIEGKTLFKGENEIYYYYRNFSSRTKEDFYKTTRMYLGGITGPWKLEVGDSYRSLESNMSGRGVYLAFNNLKINSELIASKNTPSNLDNIGASFAYNFNLKNYLKSGFAYNQNKLDNYNSKLGYLGAGFTLFNNHSLYIQGALNSLNRELNGQKEHLEYGGELLYNSSVGNVITFLRAKYGSELYFSPYAGRVELYFNSTWAISPLNRLIFSYNENSNKRTSIQGTTFTKLGSMNNREGRINYMYFVSPSISVYGGPAVENFKWDGLTIFNPNEYFGSLSYKLSAGARIRNSTGTSTLSPQVEFARANAYSIPFISIDSLSDGRSWFNFQHFSLTFRSRSFLILAFYTSGPRSAMDQINYLYSNKPSRKLQFMPTFDRFVYKDIVSVQLGLSYSNDMVAKSSYSNITGQVNWFLPKDWSFRVLGVYSLQTRTNLQDNLETYQNLYIEAGIKKEFDIQHPRVKYYDINIVFFKDFNGNSKQDDNEPGIKNILFNIDKESSDVIGKIPGDFYSSELLSDNLGIVNLERIPEGIYNITYNPIGKEAGNYSKASDEVSIKVNKSGTLYFPFVERNKVFGKIILNRSRLSGLGKMDVSNVRVTATDSQGRSYSTLTDKDGGFVLYAPITDEYTLSINNIFYENFDLRQNNFRVQFNGYKQFEVNYVFDEKIRRINFASTPGGDVQAGVMQVRRTTLSGTVKDANSQNPIRARVNLVNTKTNVVAVSTFSSATSGEYTLSFIAGDNFLIEVLADDYWYLSENLTLNQITTFMNITREVLLKPISVGSKVELNIKFDVNSSFLAPESVAELNRLVRLLRNNPSVKLQVQGHCDDLEGLQKPGVALERASAVVKYLVENGYSNLEAKSLGNTVPLMTNDSEEGRSRNRRVEVEVISK
jgi:flagellar motor protein MotB